jgi:predicted AAA-ATPase
MLQKLPLDLSTFSSLREQQYLYIDKTEYAHKMITGGHRFFLARPRRFGKSLFVSTLKEILEGNKELFEGLWIARSDYQWKPHGVIQLDMSSLDGSNPKFFRDSLCKELIKIASKLGIDAAIDTTSPMLALKDLVQALRKRFDRVAILVDEYDNPILHALKDAERAGAIRDEIRAFFATIKGLDSYIDFAFITGISSFVRADLFSGINNLRILTLDEHYAGVCGYTEEEVDSSFSAHIASWAEKEGCTYDELRKKIKEWYNGYHFSETSPSVYNPFSLMNALEAKKFKNYWFQSGTPTFLVEILRKEYKSFDPEYLEATDDLLQSSFEVNSIPLLALMFQAGYLTITGYEDAVQLYTLDYPNHEVRAAARRLLSSGRTEINPPREESELEARETVQRVTDGAEAFYERSNQTDKRSIVST